MPQEIKNRIVASATEQFLTYGFRSITMDDIAGKLGISKKTIYKYFPGKEDLLRAVIEKKKSEIEDRIEDIVSKVDKEDADIVGTIKEVIGFMQTQLYDIKPPFIFDLEKISPELIDYIETFRLKLIREKFGRVIREGVRRGVIRSDIDVNVLVDIYYNMIRMVIVKNLLSSQDIDSIELIKTIVEIFFVGVLTEDGRQKYT